MWAAATCSWKQDRRRRLAVCRVFEKHDMRLSSSSKLSEVPPSTHTRARLPLPPFQFPYLREAVREGGRECDRGVKSTVTPAYVWYRCRCFHVCIKNWKRDPPHSSRPRGTEGLQTVLWGVPPALKKTTIRTLLSSTCYSGGHPFTCCHSNTARRRSLWYTACACTTAALRGGAGFWGCGTSAERREAPRFHFYAESSFLMNWQVSAAASINIHGQQFLLPLLLWWQLTEHLWFVTKQNICRLTGNWWITD